MALDIVSILQGDPSFIIAFGRARRARAPGSVAPTAEREPVRGDQRGGPHRGPAVPGPNGVDGRRDRLPRSLQPVGLGGGRKAPSRADRSGRLVARRPRPSRRRSSPGCSSRSRSKTSCTPSSAGARPERLTPRSRTPSGRSTDSSRATATAPTAASVSMGTVSECDRVRREKSDIRSLTFTVRARRPARRTSDVEASTMRSSRARSSPEVPQVGGEGLLVTDRLLGALGDDGSLVAALGHGRQLVADGQPHGSFERVGRQVAEVADGGHPEVAQAALGGRADAGQGADGQRVGGTTARRPAPPRPRRAPGRRRPARRPAWPPWTPAWR